MPGRVVMNKVSGKIIGTLAPERSAIANSKHSKHLKRRRPALFSSLSNCMEWAACAPAEAKTSLASAGKGSRSKPVGASNV